MTDVTQPGQAGAIIAEIEFEIRNWDQGRHVTVPELARRIFDEFAGCGMPMTRAINGDSSLPNS